MTHLSREHFAPAYSFGELNESVTIAKDEALIKDCDGNILLKGDAEVRLDLQPKPKIHVYFKNKAELDYEMQWNLYIEFGSRKPFELELVNNKKQIKGYILSNNLSNPSSPSLIFSSYSEPIIGVGDDTTKVQYVIFHLFNFKNILGTSGSFEERGTEKYNIEHVNLKADNCVIELRSLADSENCFKKLKKACGYGLTHIGKLENEDNTSFSGYKAKSMLGALWYFFSFAKGDWCVPVCAVGFDSSGNRVWESWSSPKGSSFSELSWFDEHHSDQMESLFPGFMSCWIDGNWNDTLQKAIYWYITANNSGIDAGIILAQTALERLSNEYIVNVLMKEPRRGDAAYNMKHLFSSLELDIPVGITDDTLELKNLAKELRWQDNALESIILVRNALVHPRKKYRGKFNSNLYNDVFNLGLWYLELSMLKLCGYSGTYYNRLKLGWVGEVENVPWKK